MVTTFSGLFHLESTGVRSNRVSSDSARSFKKRERSHSDVVVDVAPVGYEFISPASYDSGYNADSNPLSDGVIIDEIDRMSELESLYEFRKPAEIIDFLAQHDQIIPYLIDAHAVIRKVFGLNVPVGLELFKDPEADDDKQLFGYIDTKGFTPEEAFRRLEAFDEDWYLDQVETIGEYLNFILV